MGGGGVVHADKVTMMSPTHAQEVWRQGSGGKGRDATGESTRWGGKGLGWQLSNAQGGVGDGVGWHCVYADKVT